MGIASATLLRRAGDGMTSHQSELKDGWEELEQLYRQALEVLDGLDRLGLYQAGAHLSMTLHLMRQRHPSLSSSDPDTRKSSPQPDP